MESVWSWIATPIPLLFSFLKIAPSKFILNQLASGGFYFTLVLSIVGDLGGCASRNSPSLSFTFIAIWSEVQQGL